MRSPHTSYRWRGERVIETIKCMRSPHTSYRWRGERVIEPIKWMGIIRKPWLIKASGGNLARTPGLLTPLLFTRSALGFLMTAESQDLGLTSHPKDRLGMYECENSSLKRFFQSILCQMYYILVIETMFKIIICKSGKVRTMWLTR